MAGANAFAAGAYGSGRSSAATGRHDPRADVTRVRRPSGSRNGTAAVGAGAGTFHRADPSTVELLAYLARRREPARLLIVGTYRPIEVLTTAHPLHSALQELTNYWNREELRLTGISEAA